MQRLVHGHFPDREEGNSDPLKDNLGNLNSAYKFYYIKNCVQRIAFRWYLNLEFGKSVVRRN